MKLAQIHEAARTVRAIDICLANAIDVLNINPDLSDGYVETAHEETVKLEKQLKKGMH